MKDSGFGTEDHEEGLLRDQIGDTLVFSHGKYEQKPYSPPSCPMCGRRLQKPETIGKRSGICVCEYLDGHACLNGKCRKCHVPWPCPILQSELDR